MAKRSAGNGRKSARGGRKQQQTGRSAKGSRRSAGKTARPAAKRSGSGSSRSAKAKKPGARARAASPKARRVVGQGSAASGTARGDAPRNKGPIRTTRPLGPAPSPRRTVRTKVSRIDRVRRTIEEGVPTPPSSLDMKRRGTAARSGRDEMEQDRREHGTMSPVITGGDVDADWETAYFSGDEAPGGDNPTPDQEIVDDIGKALGVQYEDNEELKSSDKVAERDRHRWELDPASSEDYKDRD